MIRKYRPICTITKKFQKTLFNLSLYNSTQIRCQCLYSVYSLFPIFTTQNYTNGIYCFCHAYSWTSYSSHNGTSFHKDLVHKLLLLLYLYIYIYIYIFFFTLRQIMVIIIQQIKRADNRKKPPKQCFSAEKNIKNIYLHKTIYFMKITYLI